MIGRTVVPHIIPIIPLVSLRCGEVRSQSKVFLPTGNVSEIFDLLLLLLELPVTVYGHFGPWSPRTMVMSAHIQRNNIAYIDQAKI